MKKPFYSKRRLKKMGIKINDHGNHITVDFQSEKNQSIKQIMNFNKEILRFNKPVHAYMKGFIGSISSLICSDIDKIVGKWI